MLYMAQGNQYFDYAQDITYADKIAEMEHDFFPSSIPMMAGKPNHEEAQDEEHGGNPMKCVLFLLSLLPNFRFV